MRVCNGCGLMFQPVASSRGRCQICRKQADRQHYANNKANGKAGARWDRIRKAVIRRDGRCTQCGSTEHLQAHRMEKYGSFHDTNLDAYLTLCRSCHGSHHGKRVIHR